MTDPNPDLDLDTSWWVICLCAEWCAVCRQYQSGFDALGAEFAPAHWRWLDIEEHEDLLDDLEIETFPTLLIGQAGQVRFFGPLLPQPGVLQRMLRSLAQDGGAPLADAQASDLLQRIMRSSLRAPKS